MENEIIEGVCLKCGIKFIEDINSVNSQDGDSGICNFCAMEQEGIV